MNLTLRVETSNRRFVLKQARPWVEKYDHIEASWDRMDFECRFYERVRTIEGVGNRMPRLLACDLSARAIMLEDLAPAKDLTSIYQGQRIEPDVVDSLADFLARLHQGTRGTDLADFTNEAMKRLNHEHIFIVPLIGWEGRDLNKFEPGLQQASADLCQDRELTRSIRDLGSLYLETGPVLCHGDFFPGSWLWTSSGIRVIDPEFAHAGQPEHDLGVAIAHLVLGSQPTEFIRRMVASYRRSNGIVDDRLLASFAGIEIIRRLLGVAQLPIPVSHGFRATSLLRGAQAIRSGSWEVLGS
jgi:5-methylthioribose kinase